MSSWTSPHAAMRGSHWAEQSRISTPLQRALCIHIYIMSSWISSHTAVPQIAVQASHRPEQSRISSPKSPIFFQKSPTSLQKSPVYPYIYHEFVDFTSYSCAGFTSGGAKSSKCTTPGTSCTCMCVCVCVCARVCVCMCLCVCVCVLAYNVWT